MALLKAPRLRLKPRWTGRAISLLAASVWFVDRSRAVLMGTHASAIVMMKVDNSFFTISLFIEVFEFSEPGTRRRSSCMGTLLSRTAETCRLRLLKFLELG